MSKSTVQQLAHMRTTKRRVEDLDTEVLIDEAGIPGYVYLDGYYIEDSKGLETERKQHYMGKRYYVPNADGPECYTDDLEEAEEFLADIVATMMIRSFTISKGFTDDEFPEDFFAGLNETTQVRETNFIGDKVSSVTHRDHYCIEAYGGTEKVREIVINHTRNLFDQYGVVDRASFEIVAIEEV